jgi:hypothetical protein
MTVVGTENQRCITPGSLHFERIVRLVERLQDVRAPGTGCSEPIVRVSLGGRRIR